ncbi:MAG: hypothetical protein V4623_03180 [Pseudomonadota bacterium]
MALRKKYSEWLFVYPPDLLLQVDNNKPPVNPIGNNLAKPFGQNIPPKP